MARACFEVVPDFVQAEWGLMLAAENPEAGNWEREGDFIGIGGLPKAIQTDGR